LVIEEIYVRTGQMLDDVFLVGVKPSGKIVPGSFVNPRHVDD
jgi:hypothetical protein